MNKQATISNFGAHIAFKVKQLNLELLM